MQWKIRYWLKMLFFDICCSIFLMIFYRRNMHNDYLTEFNFFPASSPCPSLACTWPVATTTPRRSPRSHRILRSRQTCPRGRGEPPGRSSLRRSKVGTAGYHFVNLFYVVSRRLWRSDYARQGRDGQGGHPGGRGQPQGRQHPQHGVVLILLCSKLLRN